jgi:hypothetical protein
MDKLRDSTSSHTHGWLAARSLGSVEALATGAMKKPSRVCVNIFYFK